MRVGPPATGAGPRCDRAGSRAPRIPGAVRPSYRSMPSPFVGRAMRIIDMGCHDVLLSMTVPRSNAGSAGRTTGGLGVPSSPCQTLESRHQSDGGSGGCK